MDPNTPTVVAPAETPEPESNKHNRHPKLALLGLVLVLAAAAGGYWYGHRNTTPAVTSDSNTANTKVASDTEVVSLPIIASFEKSAASPQQVPATVKLTVPTSWRTTVGTGKACTPEAGVFPAACPGLEFVDALGSATSLTATNSLRIDDLTDWLATASKVPQDLGDPNFAGVYSVADKTKVVATTEGITNDSLFTDATNVLGTNKSGAFLNPFVTNAGLNGISQVLPLVSADGALHGYSFIATMAQDPEYAPQAWVVLVGKVKTSTIVVFGSFQLNDAKKVEFDKYLANTSGLKAPDWMNGYSNGFAYGDDTIKLYNQVRTVAKSLTVTAN